MKKIICILITNCLLGQVVKAQDRTDILRDYINQVRLSVDKGIPDELLKESYSVEVINASAFFISDTTSNVRLKVYLLIEKIGLQSKELDVRKLAVDKLLTGIEDKSPSGIGNLWNALSKFNQDDFSDRAKETIIVSFRQSPIHLNKVLKLMGYLELVDMKEDIRLMTYSSHDKRDRWAALISLSRMGDKESIKEVVRLSSNLKINDDVIYDLFPDLIYTRQKEPFDYLIRVLNSNEKKCLTSNSEKEIPIPCGYRVMEQLAPVIEDFPLRIDVSGDIQTRDYEKALADIRKWFQLKGTDYRISRKSF